MQKYGLMLKHRICRTEFAFSGATGASDSLWKDYALLTRSTGADGAQERCWDGWVSSGRDDV